jgi:hypothetical protein
MGIGTGRNIYRIGTGTTALILFLLVLFRGLVKDTLSNVMGVTQPDTWIDRGVLTLSVLVGLAVIHWIRQKAPSFFRVIKKYVLFDIEKLLLNLDKSLSGITAIQNQVNDMDNRFTIDLMAIRSDVGEIEGKFRKMEETDEVRHADRMRLIDIRREKTPFLKKLSPKLADYAVLKSNSFIDFVMNIHSIKFYVTQEGVRTNNQEMDFDRILEEIDCEVGRLRQMASDFMPVEYSNIFFSIHEKNVHEYAISLKRIIDDKTNYKHRRFQEISEVFLSRFLKDMHSTFIDYMRNGGHNGKDSDQKF